MAAKRRGLVLCIIISPGCRNGEVTRCSSVDAKRGPSHEEDTRSYEHHPQEAAIIPSIPPPCESPSLARPTPFELNRLFLPTLLDIWSSVWKSGTCGRGETEHLPGARTEGRALANDVECEDKKDGTEEFFPPSWTMETKRTRRGFSVVMSLEYQRTVRSGRRVSLPPSRLVGDR